MATFIITWNPKLFPWSQKDYDQKVSATGKDKLVPETWSCGNRKHITPGDRLFLFRQRSQRGIIGSGYATSNVDEGDHWQNKGETALYVDMQWDTLLPTEQRLSVEILLTAGLGVHWNGLIASGISVPEKHASQLEKLWQKHLRQIRRSSAAPLKLPEELSIHKYVEGAPLRVVVDAYERNPQARQKCLDHYGARCAVCDFSFGEMYGDIGEGIQVHHLCNLASIGHSHRIDPIKGLRPVCPNCHTMLHKTSPPMTIRALQNIVKRGKR